MEFWTRQTSAVDAIEVARMEEEIKAVTMNAVVRSGTVTSNHFSDLASLCDGSCLL